MGKIGLVWYMLNLKNRFIFRNIQAIAAAAAAAESLQSCPTLRDPVRRWQPSRLPRFWDSPGKNTGAGCHFLLHCMKVKSESEVAQSCPTQRTHGLRPSRLFCPWDFPGKSIGVGCHCLLHDKVSQQNMAEMMLHDL